jgi:hypothetical protein
LYRAYNPVASEVQVVCLGERLKLAVLEASLYRVMDGGGGFLCWWQLAVDTSDRCWAGPGE